MEAHPAWTVYVDWLLERGQAWPRVLPGVAVTESEPVILSEAKDLQPESQPVAESQPVTESQPDAESQPVILSEAKDLQESPLIPALRVLFVADAEMSPEEAQLMAKIVAAMGLRTGDFLVETWLLRRDRWPSAEEFSRALRRLQGRVEARRPACVVTLGACAAQLVFGPEAKPADIKSRWHEGTALVGSPVLATYHPRDLLRDPTRKRTAWEDFQAVMARVGGVR